MTAEALHQPPAEARGLGRWTTSLAIVLALHGLGAALLVSWHSPPPDLVEPPAAIMIELAPPAPPTPAVEPPKPPPPKPVKQEVVPPAPPTPAPKPVVALPPPRPKPVRPAEPKPPEPILAPMPPTQAPPPPQVAVAPTVTAPPRPAVPPSYEGLLVAQLERVMRYPRELRVRGITGTTQVRFMLDRSGKVLSFTLAQSSGHRALDDEALATLRRADTLPGFPPEMAGATHEFTVPLVFRLTP